MNLEGISEVYNRYNPITQLAIRPALKLADAHNHPIRGGFAAAVASGAAHYGVLEAMLQGLDYQLGINLSDHHTKLIITQLAPIIHVIIGLNMSSLVALGVQKHYVHSNGNHELDGSSNLEI